jgi:hypothetical protein
MPEVPPGAKPLFTPDPKLVAEVEKLTKGAAERYKGRSDRPGDPTQNEKPQPKVPAKKDK